MTTFTADRQLLNPKFEGYKLEPLDQDQVISRFALTHKASQSTVPNRSPLSFQEVQSRITHNHLTIATDGSTAVYVDEDFNVVSITISDELVPSFTVVHELPKPIQSEHVEIHPEYPSSVFLSRELLVVSDGHGTMYILHQNNHGPYSLLGVYQSPTLSPFRIHSGTLDDSKTATMLFSSRNYESKSSPKEKKQKGVAVEFDLWTVKMGISGHEQSSSATVGEINVLWRHQGEEPPIYAHFDEKKNLFAVLSGSAYRQSGEAANPSSYTPSPDEIAPIPRANENLDENVEGQTKPHPYSWTQTPDSVTVAFPLPSSTQKSQIQVKFTPDSLSLAVAGLEESDLPVPLPRYTSKPLWDRVSPSTSYWTWDREAEHAFGLLSLHIDKQNEGTKWMQVFATAGQTTAAEAALEDAEVPETLDPSELWHIRESLEKYTASLRTGEDASGLGLGKGVPSLAEGEMDEEVDATIGRKAFISWLGRDDGARPSWSPSGRDIPFQLLSVPLPGGSSDFPPSLMVKEGLDGVVYVLDPADEPKWKHSSTFSAIAFVLASKRDIRFTFHTRDTAYALESGSLHRGGNAYVYRSVSRGEKWAKQAILRVTDGSGGALLGVGGVVVRSQRVLLCLAEGELILLKT
ncbi:hypothetical protein AAF712_003029 [Marasmius tenuissimus]|uniref:NudC domain-containing protein 1 n=1 Tax=Marasmius tenuissimus TaxID=585030 RepID=A0ABR3A8C5_9AGAR